MEEAFFCFNCGTQVKCKSCKEVIPVEANNCTACGVPVVARESKGQVNTFKLRENKEERIYEIKFTNEVGKEIKEVIADLLKNKDLSSSNPAYLLNPEEHKQLNALENSELKFTETNSPTKRLESGLHSTALAPAGMQQPEYPHLNDLEILLNLKENEWLLVFAFYYSNYGVNTFTKDIVWQVYKDRRKTETRFKNLGTNWKSLFKKFIVTVKENEFRFTPAGLHKVKSVLSPNYSNDKISTSGQKGRNANKSRPNSIRTIPVSRKVVASSIVPNEFDVYQNAYKPSLESFFREKNPGYGNPNRIVTIAYYITKLNHQEYFTEGNIDFAYRILNLGGKPAHLKQIIINLKNERIWFQKILDQSVNGWKLTRQAELFVEEKLPVRV
ncbi:zinc ribbon domain-containing protein [Adhaeribacter swui]|uniref:Zinc ribbon domain-containing protein n=1 Tax=Adhaeribacter swui TaxID=2086471 RepID=A0A7G7GD81_9BACT|nr:zinc ribbon domain-containing protein [Adhaeribacter swui]